MKTIFVILLCIFMASNVYGSSCPDIQESANTAMQSRNSRVSENHNVAMPDPEEEREGLANCLKTIQALGEPFTLGVTLPGIDEVVSGMCGQIDSLIQQKINDLQNQALNQINGIGGNNPLKVYGTGGEFILQLKRKIK